MSGLLDKAKKVAEDSETKATEEEKIEKKTAKEVKADLAPTGFLDSNENSTGLNMTALKFQLGAAAGFLITMILVFFVDTVVLFGDITFDDFLVPGLIVWWLVFNGDELRKQEFELKKLAISAGCFLLVTGMVAGVAMFSTAGSGVSVGSIDYDADSDSIDLRLYGQKGMEYTIEVLVDGEVEYTEEGTISIDKANHEIDLDEFWDGNSEDMDGKKLVEYEIRVTSDGIEDSMTFNDIMNREVDTAFVKVLEEYDIVSSEESNKKEYKGIFVWMLVGMGNPGASFDFDDGVFTGQTPMPIESDWDATVRVLGGNTVPPYEISADEGYADGYGDFSYDWVSLHADGGYLEKDEFYGDDGCYTFEITLENEHGETFVSTDSRIQFFWDSNSANEDTSDDKPAEAC